MITVRKKFTLNDTFSIEVERDERERRIYLVNEPMQIYRLMGIYTPNGHWEFPSPFVADEFLKWAQKFPAIKNNIFKEMVLPHEDGIIRMIKCIKRRFNIRFTRSKTKLKHII
jgi:hypothetical protein